MGSFALHLPRHNRLNWRNHSNVKKVSQPMLKRTYSKETWASHRHDPKRNRSSCCSICYRAYDCLTTRMLRDSHSRWMGTMGTRAQVGLRLPSDAGDTYTEWRQSGFKWQLFSCFFNCLNSLRQYLQRLCFSATCRWKHSGSSCLKEHLSQCKNDVRLSCWFCKHTNTNEKKSTLATHLNIKRHSDKHPSTPHTKQKKSD